MSSNHICTTNIYIYILYICMYINKYIYIYIYIHIYVKISDANKQQIY